MEPSGFYTPLSRLSCCVGDVYKAHHAGQLWVREGEAYGIIRVPYSPTAALAQTEHNNTGQNRSKLAPKASQTPALPLMCIFHIL